MLASDTTPVYPAETWEVRTPEQVGLSRGRLETLRELVGGRGCVVRHGCLVFTWGDAARGVEVASAVKPVISTLLLLAVQEGRLRSVDDPVAEVEPRLRTLNGGKRTLWVFPGLDLIVSWNDSEINDHDASPGNPDARCNQAARLIREAAEIQP